MKREEERERETEGQSGRGREINRVRKEARENLERKRF